MSLKFSRVEVVVNIASGSVKPDAPDEMRALLSELGVTANVRAPESGEIGRALREAVDAAPDLLVVLAGDGTARSAAQLCGPGGPMLAPLPGGTMNMLPHAIYGVHPWQEALTDALQNGHEQQIGGGEIEGRTFLVAAVLGSPALWAPAREAVRDGRIRLAYNRAHRAWRQAFSGRLRYSLDEGDRGKAEALAFLCPLASKALPDDEQALEAAVIDPKGLLDVARIGINAVLDDWRNDPTVNAISCLKAGVWAAGKIPAVLDGEPARLSSHLKVVWRPNVARVLAPAVEQGS